MDSELILSGAVEVELGEFRLIPGPKGEPGETGPRGIGIESAVLNPDYTLTLNFENGESYTTSSIRGEIGVGVEDVEIVLGESGDVLYYTLKITLTDGKIKELPLGNVTVQETPQPGVTQEYVDNAIKTAILGAMADKY